MGAMPFSRSFLSEDQLLCSICLEVFENPVSTPCGHSFCMSCISHYWSSARHCQCPLCKQSFKRKPDLHVNRTLREITEQFKSMNGSTTAGDAEKEVQESMNGRLKRGQLPANLFSEMKRKLTRRRSRDYAMTYHDEADSEKNIIPKTENDGSGSPMLASQVSRRRYSLSGAANAIKVPLCPKHHQNLELFCRDDLECICNECGQTEHQTHNITCAEKEWRINKIQLSITEAEIQELIRVRTQKLEEIKQSLEDIKVQADLEARRGTQLFGALIRSLECSQAALLEVTEINRRSAEHQAEILIQELEQETTELRAQSTELTKLSQTEDYITGLKSYSDQSIILPSKDWSSVSLRCDLETEAICASVCQLLDQFKEELRKQPSNCLSPTSLSSVRSTHKVKRMQEYAVDVTLDPLTAHPRLLISDDKKTVWCSEKQQAVSNSRDRFDRVVCVLGQQGFISGRHYWEVEVGEKSDWDLGVASHSCNRKGKIKVSPSNGYWFLSLRDKSSYAFRTQVSTVLHLSTRPQKIGLFVDYEKGQISFYNVDSKTHIYTFMDNFSETIYPFFSPCTNKSGKNEAPLIITPVQI
ncbi:hypothetical protein DNTS_014026 [Danionella cerebrum]|uniref:E3 ubiquitin-protein ligase TRIM39-like n=1 Tax=Danionella cerebrum TaxID=2873325 RepID=A0A553MQR2_9TELE|nr:hypothetical protein DNTS_014026 [Danionella translucida]